MAAAGTILELVVYKLNEGVSRDEFLAANEPASRWLSEQPGFVSRELVHDAEGNRWVDVVWWETLEQAQTAAELAMSSESCAPLFALIDTESMLMLHGTRALARVAPPTPFAA